jgi:cystathionine beta-synthase
MATYGFLSVESHGATVGDVLRGKDGHLPELVHGHPNETVADVVGYLREFGVSQLPIVAAEPPVMAAEVVGAVKERDILDALFTGQANLADPVERHMSAPLPTIGAGEPVSAAMKALATGDGALVLVDGKPAGVITRHDLLAFLSTSPPR